MKLEHKRIYNAVVEPQVRLEREAREAAVSGVYDHLVTLRGGPQNEAHLRKIGNRWGGGSGKASADNHSHSISYKELPPDERHKIAASREKLHSGLTPKAQMMLLPKEELAGRVWLLECQMAAVLHMLCDDPGRPASVREAAIKEEEEKDTHESRYEEFEESYKELHPEAVMLFDGFSVEEMNA